ncbi:unnamed protein product [Linum tenue]|uniref:Uncharacterized protein n=1 Tax=Linum tenue TaxID=586396 RepID=A0AAV0K0N2_9ROSI|nr:unnamed protein product [Linum tenue]
MVFASTGCNFNGSIRRSMTCNKQHPNKISIHNFATSEVLNQRRRNEAQIKEK